MNLPNQLTVSRFVMSAIFVGTMSAGWSLDRAFLPEWGQGWDWAYLVSLVIFITAAVTDYFDGEIARTRGLTTNFGKLMDPLADKVMMAAGFICLIPMHAIPAWVAIVIISREFLITGLRLLAASHGTVLSAEKLGRHKMVWQIIAVGYFLLLLAIKEVEHAGWLPFPTALWWNHAWNYGGSTLTVVATVLTLYSGLGYFWKHRDLVAK